MTSYLSPLIYMVSTPMRSQRSKGVVVSGSHLKYIRLDVSINYAYLAENWQKELTTWCPSLKLLNYYGSQDERRLMRLQIVQEEIEYDVILTTYNMVISSADDRVMTFKKKEN